MLLPTEKQRQEPNIWRRTDPHTHCRDRRPRLSVICYILMFSRVVEGADTYRGIEKPFISSPPRGYANITREEQAPPLPRSIETVCLCAAERQCKRKNSLILLRISSCLNIILNYSASATASSGIASASARASSRSARIERLTLWFSSSIAMIFASTF